MTRWTVWSAILPFDLWYPLQMRLITGIADLATLELLRAAGPGAKAGAAVEKSDAKPGATWRRDL